VNLNQRIRLNSQIHLEVQAAPDAVAAHVRQVPGVIAVEIAPASNTHRAVLTVTADKARDLRAALAASIVGAGWNLEELRPVTLSLEDIFLNLVATPQPAHLAGKDEVSRRLSA
jgi:ABC-2 type transport system ATP-binding protein